MPDLPRWQGTLDRGAVLGQETGLFRALTTAAGPRGPLGVFRDGVTQALTLAESANLLMMPSRARDQEKWMADAKLLWDVGNKAYRAAQAKNLDAVNALNDELNTACVTCHMDYRQAYGRRNTGAKQQK